LSVSINTLNFYSRVLIILLLLFLKILNWVLTKIEPSILLKKIVIFVAKFIRGKKIIYYGWI